MLKFYFLQDKEKFCGYFDWVGASPTEQNYKDIILQLRAEIEQKDNDIEKLKFQLGPFRAKKI